MAAMSAIAKHIKSNDRNMHGENSQFNKIMITERVFSYVLKLSIFRHIFFFLFNIIVGHLLTYRTIFSVSFHGTERQRDMILIAVHRLT